MPSVDATASARELLMEQLSDGKRRVALDLLEEVQEKHGALTFGLLQAALVQLIAERRVQVDEQLRVAETAAS